MLGACVTQATEDQLVICKSAPLVLILWTVMGTKQVVTVLAEGFAVTPMGLARVSQVSLEPGANTRPHYFKRSRSHLDCLHRNVFCCVDVSIRDGGGVGFWARNLKF